MSLRAPRTLMLATVAFVLGLLGARMLATGGPAPPILERAVRLPDGPKLPQLRLVDEAGAAFDGSGFQGHWTYLVLGFTACPDVCPTTMTTLAQVHRLLRGLPARLQPVVTLATVDPARDDPGRLAAFVRYFDGDFHALTGDVTAVDELVRALGAAYVHVSQPGGGYTVDHSSGLFLIGPDGRLVATSGVPHDAATIARDYRAIVAASVRQGP